MIILIAAVLTSSLIFVLFKVFNRFAIDIFQAIVFNYLTAFTCGILLFSDQWKDGSFDTGNWPVFCLICGILFISLFIVMGKSSQKNGVALTSTAVKMSMALSMLFIILIYKEDLSLFKGLGILLAFVGVYFISYGGKNNNESGSKWMLIILFVGSGILDFLLNYVQKYELGSLSPSLFTAFGFGVSAIIGSFALIFNLIKGSTQFKWKNVLAGILIGIPNYFSIYLLILAYQNTGWSDSTVLALNNVSIVILSAFIGFLIFKESYSFIKIAGLILSVSSILIIYLSGKS